MGSVKIDQFGADAAAISAFDSSGDGSLQAREVDKNRDGYIDSMLLYKLPARCLARLQTTLYNEQLISQKFRGEDIEKLKYYFGIIGFFLGGQNTEALTRFIDQNKLFLSDNYGAPEKFKAAREAIALELAAAINRYVGGDKLPQQSLLRSFAKLINAVHDFENRLDRTDVLRELICKNVSPRAAYLLMSVGGFPLYLTSFRKLLEGQGLRHLNIKDWIGAVDPAGGNIHDFVFALCKYGKGGLMIGDDADYFLQKIIEGINQKVAAGSNATTVFSLYIKGLDFVLPFASDRAKAKFVGFLIRAIENPEMGNEARYLVEIKLGLGKYHILSDNRVRLPVDKWIEDGDGVLTAKLYFYPDETWYEETIKLYGQDKNWTREDSATGVVAFYKFVNGIKLRVIVTKATQEEDDRVSSLLDPSIDIIVHRGHSYHLEKTFVPAASGRFRDKLIFAGSCGSSGDLAFKGILQNYYGNHFMGEDDVGDGITNHNVLNKLMEVLAERKSDYDFNDLRRFSELGIVLPDDNSFEIARYVKMLQEAKTKTH